MRALTTTEMEHCAGGAPAQNGFTKPENRSINTGSQTAAGPANTPLTIPYIFASPVADSEATIRNAMGYPN
jgi:hypothetical protein